MIYVLDITLRTSQFQESFYPILITTGCNSTHRWISLSGNGRKLALHKKATAGDIDVIRCSDKADAQTYLRFVRNTFFHKTPPQLLPPRDVEMPAEELVGIEVHNILICRLFPFLYDKKDKMSTFVFRQSLTEN